MNLLIHDLSAADWDRIAGDYEGWMVVSDTGGIQPCVGCFSCWNSGTGKCVIKDGYENMGELLHLADEVVYMSKYTYGGFSSFVKNVWDRSLGYVLPEFEAAYGEMHHKRRYPQDRPVTFRFRGSGLTEEDKQKARDYVAAVCRNLRGSVKEVIFDECDPEMTQRGDEAECAKDAGSDAVENAGRGVAGSDAEGASGIEADGQNETVAHIRETETAERAGILLVDCSIRGERSNSRVFLKQLQVYLAAGIDPNNLETGAEPNSLAPGAELLSLAGGTDSDEIAEAISRAETVVPLYEDGIPASALRLMEKVQARGAGERCKLYAVVNNGLYESRQNDNLVSMIRDWCGESGCIYCGALAIGAGELVGTLMRGKERKMILWPAHNAAFGLRQLAEAIISGAVLKGTAAGSKSIAADGANTDDEVATLYADPYRFPRSLYILIANASWQKNKWRARGTI